MFKVLRPGSHRPTTRALTLLALLPLLLSAPVAGKSMLATCTDSAWSEYNGCLVGASTWWMRTGCDIGFEAGYAMCWAKYVGEFKAAVM